MTEQPQQPQQSPKHERPSTYIVQDRQNQQELKRLTIQDQMVTDSMGGVLSEQSDAESFRRILDVGCATGSWAIEVAKKYPHMSIVGIDISNAMIDYARSQAIEQQVADRVEFRVMDALQLLEFPDDYFDLVNLRFAVGWVRTWDWPKLLNEMLRVLSPGGVIRLTESDLSHLQQPDSGMLARWGEMLLRSFYQAGYLFEREADGLTAHLAPLLTQYGAQHVQIRSYQITYQARTPDGQKFYDNLTFAMKTGRPFLQKWGGIPEEYDAICKQAEQDMQQPGFLVTWNTHTAWGTKPEY